MKPLLWLGLWTLFNVTTARAENFYSPLLCPVENTYLEVDNSTAAPQSFWFQKIGKAPYEETYAEVKAHGSLSLSLSDYFQSTESAVAIKTQVAGLGFSARCKDSSFQWKLEDQISPWKQLEVRPGDYLLNLNLSNLSQQENILEVSFESRRGILAKQSLVLPGEFKNHTQLLNLPYGTRMISFHGQGRWSGKILNDLSQPLELQDQTVQLANLPPARYFLFASLSPETLETFVVPVTDPAMIHQTLEQIRNPQTSRLLVARIAKSLEGTNRNFSSPTKAPWSWNVVQAQNYADFAHISCNGTPQIVEEHLNAWMIETGGTICFWNYRAVRELNPWEITQAPSWLPPGPASLPRTR